MKLFIVGDFISNTGPANVNKNIRYALKEKKNIRYSIRKTKINRIIELFLNCIWADAICFSGMSHVNVIGIKICKMLNKKTFYIMHGYIYYEFYKNKLNLEDKNNIKIINDEKYIFENVDKIFCVSEMFMEYMREKEPDYFEKFDYVNNGISWKDTDELYKRKISKSYIITSTGGGMNQKNNIKVCEAIQRINDKYKMKIKYNVLGSEYTEIEKIKSFECVVYHGVKSNNETLEIFKQSDIVIQNSYLDTFNLSIAEALMCGCNILMSKNTGILSIIKNVRECDIIENPDDVDEIINKILFILKRGNNEYILKNIDRNTTHWNNSANNLINKIDTYLNE